MRAVFSSGRIFRSRRSAPTIGVLCTPDRSPPFPFCLIICRHSEVLGVARWRLFSSLEVIAAAQVAKGRVVISRDLPAFCRLHFRCSFQWFYCLYTTSSRSDFESAVPSWLGEVCVRVSRRGAFIDSSVKAPGYYSFIYSFVYVVRNHQGFALRIDSIYVDASNHVKMQRHECD